MKCVNCGADLEEGTKFCGNCGNPVESVENVVDSVQSEEPVAPVIEPVAEEQPVFESAVEEPAFTSEVSSEPQEERQEIVQEPIPVDTPEFKKQQENGKKSRGAIKYIFIVLIVLALLAAGVFAYFTFFDKESYEKSVESIKKSVQNLGKKFENSGTVSARAEIEIKDLLDLDIKASLAYQKDGSTYKMNGRIEKNAFIDETNLYIEIDEEGVTGYIPVSFLELMGEEIGSFDYEWIKIGMDFEDLGIENFDEILAELDEDSDVESSLDLTQILTKENFEYVGRKGMLKKYTLKVNQDYIDSLAGDYSDYFEDLNDMEFNIDFYVDSKNCLNKIEINLKDALKEAAGINIDKFLFTIEFSGLNNTKVEVPASVKKEAYDISNDILDTIGSADAAASERTAELIITAAEFAYTSATMANGGNNPTIEQISKAFQTEGATMSTTGYIEVEDDNVYCITTTFNEFSVTCYANSKIFETTSGLKLGGSI